MDDKRNLVLAMVLAMLILFGWQYATAYFLPAQEPATRVVDGRSVAVTPTGVTPPAQRPAAMRSLNAALRDNPRIVIETPKLRGSINLRGARIDDLVMLRYKQTVVRNSPPVRLFSPSGTREAYFAGLGWTGSGLVAPTADTLWTAPADAKLTPTTPVTLTHDNGQGQVFEITLVIDTDYMITATQRVTNRSSTAVGVGTYGYVSRHGKPRDIADQDTATIHVGPMGVFNDAALYDVNYVNLDGEEPGIFSTVFGSVAKAGVNRFSSRGGWIGFTDKYWLGAIIPDQSAAVDFSMRRGSGGIYQTDYSTAEQILNSGRVRTSTSRIFAGAKETSVLDSYTDSGITLLDRATDWGWFLWFAKPIFYLLDWLFTHIGNFGFAIMALTLIIRLVMFPIAQKQFASMAAMRVVQPKVKALQEKYADDKPRMQQEMMALYKTEKINPLAGCVPILIQIPIFYALYKCLMLTVEMRHQPFILWIKDLSVPDPKHILNLFDLLPFTVPSFLGIGVLAVLLGVSMFVQFKLNPPPPDPVQAQVFAIMPWMLMFIMAPFAAGLLLYWITNNVLTIAQQKLLYLRYPAMKTAVAVK